MMRGQVNRRGVRRAVAHFPHKMSDTLGLYEAWYSQHGE
jgi:hypothetical protein